MPDLAGQRAAIAAVLNTVDGLRGVPSDGLWPNKIVLPAAVIRPADDAAPMNLTLTDWFEAYEVTVAASLASGLARSQRSLDALYEDVVTALVENLSGLLNLRRLGYGVIEVDEQEYLGFLLRLEMIG